jgi:hypothetical protein
MVGRAFGRHRSPGCTHFTSNVGVFTLDGGETAKWPEPVKDMGGNAVFVGDSCCDAFPVTSGGGKIKENQICFVDDEKNMSSSLALSAYGRRPCQQLQSYDVRNSCLRAYRPCPLESSSGTTWRCVTAQRFPHSPAMGPPPHEALSEEELRLQDVANCLGATGRPSYTTHRDVNTGGSRVTVQISVPRTEAIYEQHTWTFFFEFSTGGINPHLNLHSVAYKALQPVTRWVQGNQKYKGKQKESRNKKQHTPTHTEEGDSEKAQRQLPDEQSHREAASPSGPKQEGACQDGGGQRSEQRTPPVQSTAPINLVQTRAPCRRRSLTEARSLDHTTPRHHLRRGCGRRATRSETTPRQPST